MGLALIKARARAVVRVNTHREIDVTMRNVHNPAIPALAMLGVAHV
jgi:hypothetical protein